MLMDNAFAGGDFEGEGVVDSLGTLQIGNDPLDIWNQLTLSDGEILEKGDTLNLFGGSLIGFDFGGGALSPRGRSISSGVVANNPSVASAALDSDTTPPAVFFAKASFSSGTVVTLSGWAPYNGGVTGVEIFNGTTDLGAATLDEATGFWKFTTTLAAGTYSALAAVATDDAGNQTTTSASFTLVTGVTGEPYSAEEQDYSASGVLIGSDYFYTGITDKSYTGYEERYNGAGELTHVDYTGVTGKPYSSYVRTYVDGLVSSTKYEYTSVPPGSGYSSYKTVYNYTHVYTGSELFSTDINDDSNTGLITDLNASGEVWRTVWTGISDEPYTSMSDRYARSGDIYANYDYTNVAGQDYYAYQIHDGPGYDELAETEDLDSGGHRVIGFGSYVRFLWTGDNAVITGNGSNETFVLKPVFGADTITDFSRHETGHGHDTISFSTADFANFAAVMAGAANLGSSVVITAADGQTLTLDHLNTATLAGLSADFRFRA